MEFRIKELMFFLKKNGGKVTGSYATGSQRYDSDLDIFIPEKNFKEVKNHLLFSFSEFDWESSAIGQLNSKKYSPWLEISWRFDKLPKSSRLSMVSFQGVDFQTY